MKDVSHEGTVPQVPVALGWFCSLEHLSAEAATGLLCWALRLQGSPASLGLGGAQFVTALCFQSRFTLLQVGDWLCTHTAEKRWVTGASLHPLPPKSRTSQGAEGAGESCFWGGSRTWYPAHLGTHR